jgi:Aerobic-type carbon monoxide dehydrogenase, small subunit CoxS/CutS homologs
MTERYPISLSVNGKVYEATVPGRLTLADFLRSELTLTGTHIGCEHGVCGACTVLLNEEPVRACLMFAVQANGQSIITIEGLTPDGGLSSLQKRFCEHHALQCGFCTPGMIVVAESYLRKGGRADPHAIRKAISGNLCRCTGYLPIVDAIADEAVLRGQS